MTILIDGRKIAAQIKDEIAQEVDFLRRKHKNSPHLAAILVGNDPASKTYISAKEKACRKVGFNSTIIQLKENISEKSLLRSINKLNNLKSINGFIVQLPLQNIYKK